MNEPTTYTVKELNTMARLQAKEAAHEFGFNSATCVKWTLRVGNNTTLMVRFRCMQNPTALYETSIVI